MSIFKQKKDTNYLIYGIGSGFMEAAYCLFAAVFILMMSKSFVGQNNIGGLLMMLLFFVFSAALSGFLMFGYPLYLVTNKQYKEAILTTLLSVATLIVIGLLTIIIVFFI